MAYETWSPAWSNAVFSTAERDHRWARVRRLMRRSGVDLILCLPCTNRHDRGAADARYLCQLGENEDEVTLAFPIEGEPTAWQSRGGVWPSSNWFDDIRATRRGTGGETLGAWLAEDGRFNTAAIAIAGLDASLYSSVRASEGEVNWRSFELLKAATPGARFVSATPILGEARWIKSAEEVEFLRQATIVAERTLDALKASARPGVRERRVFGEMMLANADAGGSFPPMVGWVSGRPRALPHRIEQPTFRALEQGDMLMVELEGRWGGYISQVDQTLAIGSADPDLPDAMALNFEIFNQTLAAIRPGITVREVFDRVRLEGLGGRARGELNLQGRGTGDDGPLVASGLGNTEAFDVVLEENCCLLLKPNVRLDGVPGHFCRWGDAIRITATGAERLGTRAQELPIL